MRILRASLSLILYVVSATCFSLAGSFGGLVETDTQMPLENVLIVLVDDQGATRSTLTDANGDYKFENLADGWFTVYMVNPPGYVPLTPPCGYHHKHVDAGQETIGNFSVWAQSSGVVVEFGKPGGRPSDGVHPIRRPQSKLQISIYVRNLQSQFPSFPTSITVEGYWKVPGSGPISVLGDRSQSAGIYTNKDVTVAFKNLPEKRMQMKISCPSWPFLSLDGEVATIFLKMPPESYNLANSAKHLAFCVESTTLKVGDHEVIGYATPLIGVFR